MYFEHSAKHANCTKNLVMLGKNFTCNQAISCNCSSDSYPVGEPVADSSVSCHLSSG